MGDATRFGELSAALAILVGIVLVALGVLHGFVSRFIGGVVQAGFMFGLGLTIIVGQVPALLGVSKGEGDFFPSCGTCSPGSATPTAGRPPSGWAAWPCCSPSSGSPSASRRPCWWWWPASSWSPWATWPTTAWTSSARSRPCPCRRSSVGWDELLTLLPGALAIAIIGYAETATVEESLADGHGYNIQPDRS